MKKWWMMLVIAIIMTTIMTTTPSTAIVLDNAGGGYWRYVITFPITSDTSQFSQYIIQINNDYINITNSSGGFKASVRDTSFWDNVNKTGYDIRIANQTSQQYFWIQSWNYTTHEATIWVNLSKGSNVLKIYYGNQFATESKYNNPNKTFLFFDNFKSNTIGSKWTPEYGTWTISNGELYVSTSYTAAPGNIIMSNFTGSNYVAYVTGITGSNDMGVIVNAQGTSYFGFYSIDYYHSYLIGKAIWSSGAWGTYTGVTGTVSSTETYTLKVISKGNNTSATNLNTGDTLSQTLIYASGGFGLHNALSPSVPAKFLCVKIASLNDAAAFGTPYVTKLGRFINATEISVRYNEYNITGKLYIYTNNTKITPIFKYIPSNASSTGFLATASIYINATNISVYLDKNLTLNKILFNGTSVQYTYSGNYTTPTGEIYNIYNCTLSTAGTVTVLANTTPYFMNISGCQMYIKDSPELPLYAIHYINNVNATFGANISIYINYGINLVAAEYNHSVINMTYKGNITKDGIKYKVYSVFVNSSNLLNITMNVPNEAYYTKLYADNSSNFSNIICGERLVIETICPANISINGKLYTNKTDLSTTPMSPTDLQVLIQIFNESSLKFGYHKYVIPVVWGRIKVNITNISINGLIMGIYNLKYNKFTQDVDRLYAGWNKLIVYYLGAPLKSCYFYLNHSSQNQTINLTIDAIKLNSTCYNFTIVSPKSFKIINLHKIIPYGRFAINHTGEVIINFKTNPPVTVTVNGNDYSYMPPYLYIYGKGNDTITSYYKLILTAENTLGIPMNLTILLNGKKIKLSGHAEKILPVMPYQLKFPQTYMGFVLRNKNVTEIKLNLTTNTKIPTAIYKVPTYISIKTYKINTTSLKLPIPLPFISSSTTNTHPQKAYIVGKLYNWYDVPVPNANVTVKITSLKTGYTITKHVNTGTTGTFNVSFDVASGVNYSISAIYHGSNIYVESYKHIVVAGGTLPPAPSSNKYNLIVLSAIAVTVLGIGIGLLAYVLHKRSLSKAINKLNKGKYFRKIK